MEKKSKTVSMQKEQHQEESQKLTYEQLEQVANKLNSQCQVLYKDLQEARSIIQDFNDIGMLLSVLEKGEHFSDSFVTRCAMKIEEVITGMLNQADLRKEQAENTSN